MIEHIEEAPCPDCDDGHIGETLCLRCGGRGVLRRIVRGQGADRVYARLRKRFPAHEHSTIDAIFDVFVNHHNRIAEQGRLSERQRKAERDARGIFQDEAEKLRLDNQRLRAERDQLKQVLDDVQAMANALKVG